MNPWSAGHNIQYNSVPSKLAQREQQVALRGGQRSSKTMPEGGGELEVMYTALTEGVVCGNAEHH